MCFLNADLSPLHCKRVKSCVFMYVCGSFWDAVNSDSDLDKDCIVGVVVRLEETFLENYICVFSGCLWQTCLCGIQCLSKCLEILRLSLSKIICQKKEMTISD